MAAQVLQIAENIRNTRNPANPKIKSLEHAVVYIGFKQLSELIMSAALKTFKVPPSGFDVETFWNESYLIGSIAEYIVQRLQLKLPAEEIFIAGSLSNIGKLVSAFCFPPIATKLVREVSDPTVLSTWRKAESTFSFPDHSILGEIAALLWGFPTTIADAVRHHHDVPDPAKNPDVTQAELIAFANQMLHWILLRPHRMEYEIVKGFQTKTKLSEQQLEDLARELTALVQQIEKSRVAHTAIQKAQK
jgi:HD-like signal output (HDOD) protein